MPGPENTLSDPSILQNLDIPASSVPTNSALLDEDDQRAFSQFLDTLITDQDMSVNQLPAQFSSLYEISPPMQTGYNPEEEEEQRRNSILRSLDEQKRMHQRLNNMFPGDSRSSHTKPSYAPSQYPSDQWIPSSSVNTSIPSSTYNPGVIYLQKGDVVPPTYLSNNSSNSSSNFNSNNKKRPYDRENASEPKSARKSQKVERTTTRRKPQRELLTEEEKRANHIASEQKRRSTIRSGFKELTDIIPTLKNINNSKSTVLFKAVEFIKYLEKRNKSLREKVKSLEVRVQVEGRIRSMQRLDMERITKSSSAGCRDDPASKLDQESGSTDKSMAAALLMHRANEEQMQRIREELQLKSEFYAQQPATPTPRATRGFRPLHEESDARAGGYGPPMYSSNSRSSSPSCNSHQHDAAGRRQDTKKSMDVEAGEKPLKATVSA